MTNHHERYLGNDNDDDEWIDDIQYDNGSAADDRNDDSTSSLLSSSILKLDLWNETRKLVYIAMPSIVIQVNMIIIYQQSAAVVGQTLGTEALGGLSLGTLVGNLTVMSIIVGTLSASDTLMPRAYTSKNYIEITNIICRGILFCFVLLLPALVVFIQPTIIQALLINILGQDVTASNLASEWLQYFAWGIPGNILFRVGTQFLICQNSIWPPVIASTIAAFIMNPILLKVFVGQYGLIGSSIAISITNWMFFLLLSFYLYLKPSSYDQESMRWYPSFHFMIQSLFQYGPFKQYIKLAFGGIISVSEWWFWEIMCFIAGTFGIVPLCAHTVAYNLVPLLFMIPLGINIGLTYRLGTIMTFHHEDHDSKTTTTTLNKEKQLQQIIQAKKFAAYTMSFMILLGSIMVATIWYYQLAIIRIFTRDPNVILVCQSIWPMVCIHMWILNIFGINCGILKALGMQWYNATGIFVCLWCCTIPTVFYFAVYKHGGLQVQWSIIPFGYAILQIFLISSYTITDWFEQSKSLIITATSKTNDASSILSPTRKHTLLSDDHNIVNETSSLLSLTV